MHAVLKILGVRIHGGVRVLVLHMLGEKSVQETESLHARTCTSSKQAKWTFTSEQKPKPKREHTLVFLASEASLGGLSYSLPTNCK